jgi:outer membrane protein assembly factor BamB
LDRQGLKSDQWLVALDRASGRELWRVVIPSYTGGVSVEGAPGFYGNFAIFATVGGRVWAVDRSTQQIAWQFLPSARYSTPTQVEVTDGAVFVNGGDDFLYSLDAATGSVRWKANAGNGATRDLLVTGTRVYYPTGGSLLVFDRASGRQMASARVSPDGDIWETPAAAASGEIYVTTTKAAQSFAEP